MIDYEDFKKETLNVEEVMRKALDMDAVSDDYYEGFIAATREARAIFLRLRDKEQ